MLGLLKEKEARLRTSQKIILAEDRETAADPPEVTGISGLVAPAVKTYMQSGHV